MSSQSTSFDDTSPTRVEVEITNAKKLQNVFRVTLHTRKQTSGYYPRRAHKKSRAGCSTCKKRRVKCDEQKPECINCQRKGLSCCYSSETSPPADSDKVLSKQVPSSTLFSLSLDSITRDIQETLTMDFGCGSVSPWTQNTTHPMSTVAFHNFVRCSTETIASPAIRHIMRTDMIRVSFASSHLMYTILAVGMLHLNRASPSKERSLAESYFWSHALQHYQKALSSTVNKNNVDALLSSCMLMSVNTVCPENFHPTESWVLTNKPESMNWLSLQSGLRCILSIASPYLPSSIWAAPFAGADQEGDKIFGNFPQGREGLDPDLADLCGIDELTTERDNVYYAPLRMITSLLALERDAENSGQCTSFMGRLECEFVNLLRGRDPPALIILAHWMGLMCCLSEWQPWIEGRIRGECVAICMFLEHSADPRVLRSLRFPAEACGYKLHEIHEY